MKKLQRGLPKGKYSKYGYKRNSPDVNKPFNIIPSGRITMQDVDFPVRGVDNLGNEMLMVPGGEYFFPGDYVIETPLMQRGGPKFQQYTPAAESTGANYTPTYFAGTLPEVMVSSDDTSYPYYNKLTAEEKKYFNQNSPIGRAVRSIAFTGKRGKTANDLGKIARGVEEFAAEMTGIPGSIRFSQDPVKKLKGLGRTVEATILGSSPFITAPYNKEDVADTFDALDALGFATTTAGLAKMPLQKAANLTGRYLAQGPTINIPKQLLGSSNALNLEELRRVYHNSERFLQPEEARFLHKHGHGLRENYRTSDSVWNNQQNLSDREINILSDIVQNNNQLPPIIPPRQAAKQMLDYRDINTSGVYNIRSAENALVNWAELNRFEKPNFEEDAFRHIINRYNIPNNTRNLGDAARSLDASQKPQFLRDVLSEIPRLMSTDDLFRARINYQNSVNNIASTSTPRNKPLIKNKSGLTKEEALQKATAKDKDVISKMSENEFSNTVLKPTGEIVPYESQADLMPHFTGSNNVFAMSPKEYADEFNLKLDLLNDIIAQRNKSGVEYRVKGLDESGRLTFYTPPGQKGKNPLIKKGLEDIEIPAGESIWSVGINPGEWRGNVEDIANTQYFRSIPGLEMRNTTNTVFSDGVPRKGTGAYEAINEYLKRLDLGRVKPGFNSQTEFSRGAWENFIKSGRGVGFYGNPNTIYGTMKTIVPPAAIGVGAYGVNQKQDAQPTMQKFGGNLNFQFGGYIPSWLNPMNWGVTDYTGKKDFNSAYAAARQAGEKEFMWNGKRFNTDYKGTPQQQLKETGLTNEQIQDRSKLNKNLTKNIYPYSYDNLEKRIWAAGVLGKKEENREAIDKDPRPYDKEKLDALNLYAGVPQKNNTFRISNYKPSTSKDNINYYTFNKQDDRFVKNLIDYAYLKSKGAIDRSAKDYDIDVKGLVPDQEKNVMGNYKMSTGKDDRGTYVSFYDKWDLAPMDFGKPFEIYDRIYTKDYSDGKQKRMYYTDKELLELDINKKNFDTLALQRELANRGYKLSKSTKKDGIFDGILGEETKKALEDWQKKNFKKQFGGKLPKYQDKGSVQPRKNNKIYSFLGDMIDRAEKATNETSKFLGDILAPITPDYKTEEEREMLFRRHRPVPYPGIVAGLKDIYIDYTNKKTGNPYLDNFIQNYTVEQKKPFLDEKGDYNIAEEAWRMSLGLPVKNKYIKKSNYRPLDEKNKNSKYYTLNNVIDYNALRNKVKELKIKPGNFVQMESLSPFIKDKFMNKEEFAEIDPLQRFKLGVNKKGKMYIWDKYDFNFAPLQKVIEPYQYEFYDEFQNGGMMQRKDLPKAQSLREFIPSWANPMNWNVEDYSNKTDFNKAYSAAKKAGKKEFMFNGKRYNTKYAGTPRQEVGVYGVQGKPVHHMNLNDPAQVNLYPAFGKYLPGHISASIGDNQTSVDYSRKGNYPYGINKVKNKGEKSFNVYGQDNLTFSNKVASLPTGNYFVEDKYRPSDWNLFTNNCADNVCDAFGIPRSKGIQTPKAAMQKIQKKYPTLDVTGRRYDDYYDLGVKLRPISFHRPDEVLNQTKNLVGILSSPDLNNTKASEKITFALQNALLKKGYKLPKSINKDGELDGILGDETKAALEDWQKKNSKKQLGGALLKAQFGAFGTIPTSPPFMPQKENVVTSKKVDNLPKIKVNTTVPDEMITIKDGRKIRLTTGQAINPNTDLVGKSYSTKALRSILNTAKNRGLSKDDALTLAAMDLQETRWGETDDHMGHVLYGNNSTISPAENFINAYLRSKETANRLKLSDEYTRLQVYNGLGKVTPNTEKDYHGFRMKKIYGVPVPESGIDMKKNPLYGKQIVDIRDNVLKQNSEFLKLVDEYYKMGGITNEMLDIYKNYINGVYTNTEKEKDAIKVYDKLNRKYYREAKNANKSVPNYIMSLIK